jgi:hypothetical protein
VRALADRERIARFMRRLGAAADADTRVYLTGGTTAVLFGWRDSTIDVDIRVVPESDALYRAIPALKEELRINVELASPDQFIPVRDGWEDRSPFVVREGRVSFHHFDLYAQALAKIERGHTQDVADVAEMLNRQLIERDALLAYYEEIAPRLYRYPAIDAASFAAAVRDVAAKPNDPKVS